MTMKIKQRENLRRKFPNLRYFAGYANLEFVVQSSGDDLITGVVETYCSDLGGRGGEGRGRKGTI